MSDYTVVMTTFASDDQARPVIEGLLEERLVACAQVAAIASHYVWQGETRHEPEVLVLFKTRASLFQKLQARVAELHPYDIPELIQVPITGGHGPYLDWINEATNCQAEADRATGDTASGKN